MTSKEQKRRILNQLYRLRNWIDDWIDKLNRGLDNV